MSDDSNTDSTYSLDDRVSTATRELIRDRYGDHSPVMRVFQPPVHDIDVTDVADTGGKLAGRLHGLAWIAHGINEASTAVMPKTHFYDPDANEFRRYDEPRYPITRASAAEVRIAVGLLHTAFERELEACAGLLDVDDEDEYREEWGYDHRRAIRDGLDYEPGDQPRPVREIADELDESPEAVAAALAERFGTDAVDDL